MTRLYLLLITIIISFTQTIKLNKPIQVDYYQDKLNRFFLDQNQQLWFEFVKSIEVLNPKTTICKSIPYQFKSENPITLPFNKIISTQFDNELKTLYVLEQDSLTLVRFLFTNLSISTYHYRNGQTNQINQIKTNSYNISNGIALTQLEKNYIVILNDQKKLILFDIINEKFNDLKQFQFQPIWITSANNLLFVAFEDKLICYTVDQLKLTEINQIDTYLKDASILMVEQNAIFLQFPSHKVIKINFSQQVLQFEEYLNENYDIKSLAISNQKINYLTNENVFFNSGYKLFESYDQLFQLKDLIVLISSGGVHKVLLEFSDELSYPLYLKHFNISGVYLMNSFGINYHLITKSQELIQIHEIQIIESFIECDERIENNKEALYFRAYADGCHNRLTMFPSENCNFEGQIHFNRISVLYQKFSDLTLLIILVIIFAIIIILLAIFQSRKYLKQGEQYTISQKVLTSFDQSRDQIIQQQEY